MGWNHQPVCVFQTFDNLGWCLSTVLTKRSMFVVVKSHIDVFGVEILQHQSLAGRFRLPLFRTRSPQWCWQPERHECFHKRGVIGTSTEGSRRTSIEYMALSKFKTPWEAWACLIEKYDIYIYTVYFRDHVLMVSDDEFHGVSGGKIGKGST